MRYRELGVFVVLSVTFAFIVGCGQEQSQAPPQKAQSQSGSEKPIDTELQQYMKMYQEIKQQEHEQYMKKREAEKKRLKALEKSKQEALKREVEFLELQRSGGNNWNTQNKKDQSSNKEDKSTETENQKQQDKKQGGQNQSGSQQKRS